MRRRRALAVAAAALAAPAALAQKYPQGTKQRELRFAGSGGVMLAGTLLLPMTSEMQYVPGVVLVAGSGPTDRDGNNPLAPIRIDLLKQIAELLARAGIASLRYDKRGIGASEQPAPNRLDEQERFFAWENFVGDVQAAHAELLQHDEIKPYATALLGHSEGALLSLAAIATMGAAMAKHAPYGLVLAGSPGLPLRDIVRAQIGRNAPTLLAGAERVMAAILDTGHVPADAPAELQLIFPAYGGPFFKSALTFDPAKAVASIDTACLMLHGGADTQIVPLGDIQPLIDALAARGKPGEVLVAPLVSHNLKTVAGPTDPGFAGPIAPAIADKLSTWLAHVLGA
jgi:alpha-beta hydrolase superfamily lysophospholipase